MGTMDLSRTVSEINGDFSRNHNFSPTGVLNAPLKGFTLQCGIGAWVKNFHGVTGLRKKLEDIFSCLDTIHKRDRETDGRTDGRTPTDSKDRAYA